MSSHKVFADGRPEKEAFQRIRSEEYEQDLEWLDGLQSVYGDRPLAGKGPTLRRHLADFPVIPASSRRVSAEPSPAPKHERIAIGIVGQVFEPADEFSCLLGGTATAPPESAESVEADYRVARASHLRDRLLTLLRQESASRRDLILLLSAYEPRVASMALTLLHSRLITVRGEDPLAVLQRVTGGAAEKIAAGTWGATPDKRQRDDQDTWRGAIRSFDPLENGRTIGQGLDDVQFSTRVRVADARANAARTARRGGRQLRTLGRSMFRASALVDQFRDPLRRADQSSGGLLSSITRGVGDRLNAFLDTPEGPAMGRRMPAPIARRGEAPVNEQDIPIAELESSGSGQPLPRELAGRMRLLLGHDFSHVRVHLGGKADRSADQLQARAFTVGSDIYFRAQEWAPGSLAFERLLIHELTHVVQHDQGRLRPASGRNVTDPDGAAEREARDAESKAGAPAPVRAQGEEAGASRVANGNRERPRLRLGEVGTKTNSAGKTAAPKSLSERAIISVVNRVSPGLAKLIDVGPGQMIKSALEKGVKGFVKGASKGAGAVAGAANAITTSFAKAFGFIKGLLGGDAACCAAVTDAIQSIRDVASAIANNPVVKTVKSTFNKVNGAIKKVGMLVLSPVFDMLKKVAGGAWKGIKAIADQIGEWTSAVKAAATSAYNWVMKKLGLGGGGSGIWDWIKKQAKKIWDSIAKTLKPVAGPLKAVAASLLMFTGLPQIYALIKYGPKVVDAVKWLWANKGDPNLIVKAREKFGPALSTALSAIKGLGAAMTGAANWLVTTATKVASNVLSLLGAISGVPLLSMAKGLVAKVEAGIKKVAAWATSTFKAAVADIKAGAAKFGAIIKPYLGIITKIGIALTNPAMIPVMLAGSAWLALPDCIKGPIIDLILDAVIGFLKALPSLPMLGLLWPMLKAGVIGFFQGVRAQETPVKVAVSNKLAKIISGGSPAFILGFAKGLAAGLWEGLTDPFKMIWSAVSGLHRLLAWFEGTTPAASASAEANSDTKTATANKPPAAAAPAGGGESTMTKGGGESTMTKGAPSASGDAPAPAAAGTVSATTIPGQSGKPTVKELNSTLKGMGAQLKEPISTASKNVMPAAKEAFQGGPGITLEGLMAKLGKWWSTIEGAIRGAAAGLAGKACQFMMGDGAEGKLGEGAGWLVGTIAFELLLNYFTGGGYKVVGTFSKAVKTVARILDWTGEAMSLAFKGLAKVGGVIKKGIGAIAEMIGKTAAGGKVIGALKRLANMISGFAGQLLGRFGKGVTSEAAEKAAKEASEKAAKETAETAAERAAKEGAENATEKASRKAAKEAEEKAAKEAGENAGDAAKKGDDPATAGKKADDADGPGKKKGDEPDAKKKKGDTADPAEKQRVAGLVRLTSEAMDAKKGIPAVAILASIKAMYMPRYKWIKDFTLERVGPGHYKLHMIASDIVAGDLDDENAAPGTKPNTPKADGPAAKPDGPAAKPDGPAAKPDAPKTKAELRAEGEARYNELAAKNSSGKHAQNPTLTKEQFLERYEKGMKFDGDPTPHWNYPEKPKYPKPTGEGNVAKSKPGESFDGKKHMDKEAVDAQAKHVQTRKDAASELEKIKATPPKAPYDTYSAEDLEKAKNGAEAILRKESKELGEQAGEAYASKNLKGFEELPQTHDGARAFDKVYRDPKTGEIVILECKGGKSGLNDRFGPDGKTRVQQGSEQYLEAVIKDIEKREAKLVAAGKMRPFGVKEPAHLPEASGANIKEALDLGNVRYVEVRQPIKPNGDLGPVETKEFDI